MNRRNGLIGAIVISLVLWALIAFGVHMLVGLLFDVL